MNRLRKKNLQFLFFSDLDGTLLDHTSYSFNSALPALNSLKEKSFPLIICTSKTRAEIEQARSLLDIQHPFISENGGAVFIPRDYFSCDFSYTNKDSDYLIIEFGTSYLKLREAFAQIKSRLPGKLKGFGDMSAEEVADLCGFSLFNAALAKAREYDEPFLIEDLSDEGAVRKMAADLGFQITRGGRFYHLTGNNDKGRAVVRLREIYKKQYGRVKTVALGDSLNDLPMLKVADLPVLVQKPDKSYDPSVKVENIIYAPGVGPSGWCSAVLDILAKIN